MLTSSRPQARLCAPARAHPPPPFFFKPPPFFFFSLSFPLSAGRHGCAFGFTSPFLALGAPELFAHPFCYVVAFRSPSSIGAGFFFVDSEREERPRWGGEVGLLGGGISVFFGFWGFWFFPHFFFLLTRHPSQRILVHGGWGDIPPPSRSVFLGGIKKGGAPPPARLFVTPQPWSYGYLTTTPPPNTIKHFFFYTGTFFLVAFCARSVR